MFGAADDAEKWSSLEWGSEKERGTGKRDESFMCDEHTLIII